MDHKAVHLIDTGGPGGAETVFSELAGRLPRAGWEVVPVVPEAGWLRDRLAAGGLDPVVLGSERSFDVAYLVGLVRLLRRSGGDLVHAHLLASGVYGSLAAGLCGLPVVCTFHGSVDVEPASVLTDLKLRLLDLLGTRVVCVSEDLRRRICGPSPLNAEEVTVIHNGIDVDRYRTAGDGGLRRELGVEPHDVLVGAVGNVRPAKNYELFLEVAGRLHDGDSRFRFVVVGDDDNELGRALARSRSGRGLEEVVSLVGLRDDVPEILADLDVYLLTSSTEGFSLTTVEAMASGLPVVATRCGGPEEIIEDGVDGQLVNAGSADALVAAVRQLTASPEVARRMGRRARQKAAAEFSIERMVDEYAALYEDCLA